MRRAAGFIVAAQVVTGLSVAGCGGNAPQSLRSGSPTVSFPVSPSPQPAAPTFAVSGVVTEYRLGPIAGVTMRARPNSAPPPWPPDDPRVKTIVTDVNGFYRIDGLTQSTILDAMKEGFDPSGYGAFTGDRVINITLKRRLSITAGETLNAVIWGDSELSGEDWTGANCDHKACVMTHVTTNSAGLLTARLKWNGHANDLGVFISTGFFGGQGAKGSSPLEASTEIRSGETLVVVSFDKAEGAKPLPSASQSFELTTAFSPR
jgi:hypothetical protein